MLRGWKPSVTSPVICTLWPTLGHFNAPGPTRCGVAKRGQDIERVDVSEPASISTGIAVRYARAVYELAKESSTVAELQNDISTLTDIIAESADFNALIHSPVYARREQAAAITELAKAAQLGLLVTNTLALMAGKRRLFVLPQLLQSLRDIIAEENGEVTADVTSAKAMTKAQSASLAKTLKARMGKDVTINASVDESLIGGLIVKVGSKMIDTSIRSKLSSLQNAMKEVG
jgi:F-type H+-transporting ATPase subunit delta